LLQLLLKQFAFVGPQFELVARPRNQFKLRNPGPQGWGSAFEGDRKDSSQIATDVDAPAASLN
jgi:hypothetical protein